MVVVRCGWPLGHWKSMYIGKYWSVEAHSLFHTTRGVEFMAMESLAFYANVTRLVTLIL